MMIMIVYDVFSSLLWGRPAVRLHSILVTWHFPRSFPLSILSIYINLHLNFQTPRTRRTYLAPYIPHQTSLTNSMALLEPRLGFYQSKFVIGFSLVWGTYVCTICLIWIIYMCSDQIVRIYMTFAIIYLRFCAIKMNKTHLFRILEFD